MTTDERAVFEAYILTERGPAYLEHSAPVEDDADGYTDPFVQEAWEAWKARAALNTCRHMSVKITETAPRQYLVICKGCGADLSAPTHPDVSGSNSTTEK